MRNGFVILALAAIFACSARPDVDKSFVGAWLVAENVSNQLYEMEFREDGTLRLTVDGEVHLGQFNIDSVADLKVLNIEWSNGSRNSSWIVANSDGSLTTYEYHGESSPDFKTAFKLGDMTKIEM